MKPLMMIAAGSIAAALFIPQLVPDGSETAAPTVSEKNITREKSLPQKTYRKKSRRTNRTRGRDCERHSDLGMEQCSSVSPPPRKKPVKKASLRRSAGGRSVMIARDASGHFKTTARMNGRRVPVLVDTGATSVAINVSLARRLGMNVRKKDFIHKAQTANGVVKFARGTIPDIRIGGIVLDGVDASVLPDNALSTTLLGMSFLNRLTKYQVENGELKLTQ